MELEQEGKGERRRGRGGHSPQRRHLPSKSTNWECIFSQPQPLSYMPFREFFMA